MATFASGVATALTIICFECILGSESRELRFFFEFKAGFFFRFKKVFFQVQSQGS